MRKYDLVKRTMKFNRRDRREIKQGCTALDPDPEYIKTFDDLEEAEDAANNYEGKGEAYIML